MATEAVNLSVDTEGGWSPTGTCRRISLGICLGFLAKTKGLKKGVSDNDNALAFVRDRECSYHGNLP